MAPTPKTPAAPSGASPDPTATLAELAWTGQHAQAIDVASQALAAPRLSVVRSVALLDRRAESRLALGQLAAAEADAAQMLALAAARPALQIVALNRQAAVLLRRGASQPALRVANQAVQLARHHAGRQLLAQSLLRLGEAQFRAILGTEAVASGEEAARLFTAAGDTVGAGRAHWVVAFAESRRAHEAASRAAALRAADLARQVGDDEGLGQALNVLGFSCRDIAERIGVLEQAAMAFERCNVIHGRAMVQANLALAYAELGLYRRASRIGEFTVELWTAAGSRLNLIMAHAGLLSWHLAQGDLDWARKAWPAFDQLVADVDEPLARGVHLLNAAEMVTGDGNPAAAARMLRAGLRKGLALSPGFELLAMVPLAKALLADGQAGAALRVTRQATRLHEAQGLARADFGVSVDIWWWHHRALFANGDHDASWQALQRAHGMLLDAMRNVQDEGLRRCYLNKVGVNRELVRAWLRESARRKLSEGQRLAHLQLATSLREPFQRLLDTGLRLNELHSSAALHDFVVDEVTELSGAERVLLVLHTADGWQLAGALLPRGEEAQALLQAVTPWLDEARHSRTARLRQGPESAAAVDQRSCLVAPLIAQHQLLGCLYADIEGAFGRFSDADRDLLAMLASQAAVALAHIRANEGLEQKVAERTAQLEQRAGELAVINGIQQGMAAELSFQAIVDLVGDRLREVLRTGDAMIVLWDEATGTAQPVYAYQRGVRIELKPLRPNREGTMFKALSANRPVVANSRAEMQAWGLRTVEGTQPSLSTLMMPVHAAGRLICTIALENHERENAFGEAEVRLLGTIAASMGVSLENARLFDETQRLLKETEARNAELAVINSIQQGMAGSLNFQGIVDLVGDTLRKELHTDTLGIRWYDAAAHRVLFLYEYERGRRIQPEPRTPVAGGPVERMIASRQGDLYRNPAELRAAGLLRVADEPCQSAVRVPIVRHEHMVGFIVLENYEREDAYGPSELRLLQTIASSMGVALENARLFDETQRLLKETERRSSELALINGIQHALAAELDFVSIVEMVGERLRTLFDSDDIGILWRDDATHRWCTSTSSSAASACNCRPSPPTPRASWGKPCSAASRWC